MRHVIFMVGIASVLAAGSAVGGRDLSDDVNRDARGDIFFRGGSALAYWTLGGTAEETTITSAYAGDAGPGFRVVAVDDYDGDDAPFPVEGADVNFGSADVLWSDGSRLKMWINNGSGRYDARTVGNYGGGWQPFAAGDVNNDGKSDIFFRGGTALAYWLMDGANVIGSSYAGDGGAGYRVVAINDFDGDYAADVLWTNGSQLKLWLNDGAGSYHPVMVGSYGGGWQPFAAGDVNHDGHADVLFRGGSHVAYWLMTGSAVLASSYAGDGGAGFRAIAVSGYDSKESYGNRWDYDTDNRSGDILWSNGSQIKLWRAGSAGYKPAIIGAYGGGWEPLGNLIPLD